MLGGRLGQLNAAASDDVPIFGARHPVITRDQRVVVNTPGYGGPVPVEPQPLACHKLQRVVLKIGSEMVYRIDSTWAGGSFTLFTSSAIVALAELSDMPKRGHENVSIMDLDGNRVDRLELRNRRDREWKDHASA